MISTSLSQLTHLVNNYHFGTVLIEVHGFGGAAIAVVSIMHDAASYVHDE